MVAIEDIDALLQQETPRAEANPIAAELLATCIRREKSWTRSERARQLISLCQRLVAVSGRRQ